MVNTVLPDKIMTKLEKIQEADLIIGLDIPYNSVNLTVEAVAIGMAKYFPDIKYILVKSESRTGEKTFLNIDPYENRETNFIFKPFMPLHRIVLDEDLTRKDFIKNLFQISDILNSEACLILSGELDTIIPEWVEVLLTPVLKGNSDYILPKYVSHQNDFTIAKNLVSPLIRALFNINLPHGGGEDYCISIDLARTALEKNLWDNDMDIDTALITTAVGEGFEIGQAFLGNKSYENGFNILDLSNKFSNTLKTLIKLIAIYGDNWRNYDYNRPKEIITFGFQNKSFPLPFTLNLKAMILDGKGEYEKYHKNIKEILSNDTHKELQNALISLGDEKLSIKDDLWVKIILDYINYFINNQNDYNLINSISPLFLFRYASFIKETKSMKNKKYEERRQNLFNEFKQIREEIKKEDTHFEMLE